MSEYIKGNMGLVRKSIIECLVIKRSKNIYAIYKEKEILINICRNKVEAELFLNECMTNMEKDEDKNNICGFVK